MKRTTNQKAIGSNPVGRAIHKQGLQRCCGLFLFFRIETLSDEDGGGFLISYPNLAGCVSDGETTEEAMEMGTNAKHQSAPSAR